MPSYLDVRLLQDLCQFYPRFDVVGELFRDLLEMRLCRFLFGARDGVGVKRAEDLHRFVIAGLHFEHFLEAQRRVFRVASIDVHLTEAELWQDERRRGELRRLIVVLKSLIVVVLHVKGACELITAFRAHVLVLRAVKRVQRQVLHLLIVLFEKEMVGQMIQHHRIGLVDLVRARELLHGRTDRVGSFEIHLENGEADESPDAAIIQFQRAFECHLGLFRFAEFDEAVAHAKTYVGGTTRVFAESLLVKRQRAAKVLFVEGDASFAQQRWNVFGGLKVV